MHPVFLPVLDANMTHGTIRAWLKAEGETVAVGEPLFEVETDKVNAEVEAEASGVLRRVLVEIGERVPVLQLLAFIGGADEPLPDQESWEALQAQAPEPMTSEATFGLQPETVADISNGKTSATQSAAAAVNELPSRAVAASPAARRLAREKGIALETIRGSGTRGEITRGDVLSAIAAAPLERVSAVSADLSGRIDPGFLAALRRDGTNLRSLSSQSKVQMYREHGAVIGESVTIEPGALIIADTIRIAAGASIGADGDIDCHHFELGRLAALGKRLRVRCRSLRIGDALWGKDDVVIGGGGSDHPEARLEVGDAGFFGEGAYLNPSHPIVMGDEVCIGSRAMLFTHSHWQSVLRGYPSLFGPIHIGEHVFVGNQTFVFPGITIGPGATVMVNSFVAVNVAADVLVGGVPAQVIRHITAPTRDEQIRLIRERLLPDLAQVLRGRGFNVQTRDSRGTAILDLGVHGAVQFLPEWQPATLAASPRIVALSFADGAAIQPAAGLTLFNLASSMVTGEQDGLSDEVREYLRRRGIRFRPYAWRYRVGHCEGDRLIAHPPVRPS